MKDITFKHVKITNWKGFKSFETDLSRTTNIYGKNRAGKSSIMDAIIWCLFGKDAQGRSDFEIKPLNEKNEPARKQEHEVELVVFEDNYQIKFRRVFREKWVKKRGDSIETFAGHESVLFYQDVPVLSKEYTEAVSKVIDESVFRMLTDPNFFHSLHWQKRRELLEVIGGEILLSDIAAKSKRFADLLEKLQGKDLELHRKGLVNQRKDIKEELEGIQPRIDEVERQKPEPVDEKSINKEIESLERESESLSKQIDSVVQRNQAHDQKVYDISKQINTLKESIETIKRQDRANFDKQSETANSQRRIALREAQERQDSIDSVLKKIATLEADRNELVQKKAKVSEDWKVEHARTLDLDDADTKCPVCKSPYDESIVEERQKTMKENFNLSKAENLKQIESKGFKLAEDISAIADKIVVLKEELETKQSLPAIKVPDEVKLEYDQSNETTGKIETIEGEIVELEKQKADLESGEKEGYENLREQRTEIQSKITTLKASLQVNSQIVKADARIKELEAQEKELANKMAEIEGELSTMEDMTKARMDMVEENIADKFEEITFKMFERQINEGEKPTCITLFKGVPYEALNTEAKLRASLQVIRTLQNHYNVMAPIIIDNRESVTDIPDMNCQIINMIVSPKDEKLKIELL